MLIHTGDAEMLNAQIKRFAARAEAAGGDVALIELPTMWHSGHVLAGLLRESTQAVHDVGVFVRSPAGRERRRAGQRAAARLTGSSPKTSWIRLNSRTNARRTRPRESRLRRPSQLRTTRARSRRLHSSSIAPIRNSRR